MPINPLHLLPIPLILSLTGLLLAAIGYDLKTFRRKKSKDETLYRCNACHSIYTNSQRTPLAHCPKCGKQNEPIRPR